MTNEPEQRAANASDNINSPNYNQNQTVDEGRAAQQANENGWHTEEREHKREERTYWKIQKVVSAVTLIFSLVAAGGAAAGAYIAFNAFKEAKRQADAAETQIGVARDTEERQLRAYVSIMPVTLVRLQVGTTPIVGLGMKNVGLTPARNGYQHYGYDFVPIREDRDYTISEDKILTSKQPIGLPASGSEKGYPISLEGNPATNTTFEQFSLLVNRKAVLVMKGEFSYEDIFKIERHTRYCYFYGMDQVEAARQSTDIKPVGSGNLLCKHGNEED